MKDDIGLLNNKALCLMNLKRCNEALKVFDQILLLGDNSNEVLLNRAYCLVKNEMYCEALKCLVKIEHEDEKLHDIFILQGICYEKLGDNVKAVESFNKALTSVG